MSFRRNPVRVKRGRDATSTPGAAGAVRLDVNGSGSRPRLAALPARHYGVHGMPKELIEQIWADYQRLKSFEAVGKLYGRTGGSIRTTLLDHGKRWQKRNWGCARRHGKRGCFLPYTPPTPAVINAALDSVKRIMVPAILKMHWRHISLEEKGRMIERMRARLKPFNTRPEQPFSKNVEPWDYSTQRAHDIAVVANQGFNSRTCPVKLKLASQGVIWRGQLYFWVSNNGYLRRGARGTYNPDFKNVQLHREIWETHHRRSVPPKHIVGCRDGNPNNLDPKNLYLLSMADNAVRNKFAGRAARGEAGMAALMDRFNRGGKTLAAKLTR